MSVDYSSARRFLYYLGRASALVNERELARRRLELTLRQLRSISTKSVQVELEELERRMNLAIDLERKLVTTQQKEGVVHQRLSEKLESVERKLAEYVRVHQLRESRVKEIEHKIIERSKQQSIRDRLQILEKKYVLLAAMGKHDAKLNGVKARISQLKRQLH